jgi:hypothetical protein
VGNAAAWVKTTFVSRQILPDGGLIASRRFVWSEARRCYRDAKLICGKWIFSLKQTYRTKIAPRVDKIRPAG